MHIFFFSARGNLPWGINNTKRAGLCSGSRNAATAVTVEARLGKFVDSAEEERNEGGHLLCADVSRNAGHCRQLLVQFEAISCSVVVEGV